MGYRLSKIYTRAGDDGTTQVEVGKRIAKNDVRIIALGDLDETNSAIGLMLSYLPNEHTIKKCFTQIQHELFDVGGELCPPHHIKMTAEKIARLEAQIDEWNSALPPLTEFILPRGNQATSTCHLARAICRRAEEAW